MSHANDLSQAKRLELEKRELEHLLRISERAQGVMTECKRVLAARSQNLIRNRAVHVIEHAGS